MHAPDLYEGHTFDKLQDGAAYARQVGFETIIARGVQAAERLPEALVYAGFSLGVLPAQKLAQTRKGARGALLYHACAPASEFGQWPGGVPVQIHAMDGDPYFIEDGDLDAARALVQNHELAKLILYPGTQHLFADSGLASYDAAAAQLLMVHTLSFLRQVK